MPSKLNAARLRAQLAHGCDGWKPECAEAEHESCEIGTRQESHLLSYVDQMEERIVTRITQHVSATLIAAFSLAALCSSAAAGGQFQTTSTTFSGQATAVKGTILGIPIVLADTGPVNPEGGKLEAHLLCYPEGAECAIEVPDATNGMLQVSVLNATVVSQGSHSRARASVADLALNVAGQSISATFLEANARAQCADGQAFVRADSELATLTVNGQTIVVTGEVNQRVVLPGVGEIVINEQAGGASAGDGDVTVRALHIRIPGIVPGTDTDFVVAEAHADIHCGQRFCPADKDFVTGGGWMPEPRRTFAVAGGIRNNAFWGHFLYQNHGTGVRAKGTGVTAYTVTGPTARHIEGTAEINGMPGTYEVDIDDGGEPGRGADFVRITLRTSGETVFGLLGGGNIQLHTCK
jgi:hypothetical protein